MNKTFFCPPFFAGKKSKSHHGGGGGSADDNCVEVTATELSSECLSTTELPSCASVGGTGQDRLRPRDYHYQYHRESTGGACESLLKTASGGLQRNGTCVSVI